MKFKLPDSVTRTVGRQILITKKHSPTILFAGGVIGAVASTVLACRATLKLEDVLMDAQKDKAQAREVLGLNRKDYTETDYKKDMSVLYMRHTAQVCKLYAPALIIGGASIAALTGSHKILTSRNTGLTAAYAILEKGFSDYRGRVVDEYGDEKDKELRFGSETGTVVVEGKNGPKKIKGKTIGDGSKSPYAVLFSEQNQNWSPQPEYNVGFLRGQQMWANDLLRSRGHVMLNEVHDLLGLPRTPAGTQVGWLWEKNSGDNMVDFGIWDGQDMMRFYDFVTGREGAIWLDFNVDGIIWDKI